VNRWLFATVIVLLYALHQDFWLWRSARPLVFGFLPVGLAYHAAFTLVVAAFLAVLVRWAWPSHLEGRE
jgi:predicted exporter